MSRRQTVAGPASHITAGVPGERAGSVEPKERVIGLSRAIAKTKLDRRAVDELMDPRDDVAAGCRVLAGYGHGDLIWGHVSVRDPQGSGTWMKRRSIGIEETRPEDVLLIDGAGRVVRGDGEVHGEFPIHTQVLQAHPEVNAVVHTHAAHAVAFDALAAPLLPISHEATLFVPPDVPRFRQTADLIQTLELGNDVAAAITGSRALLLRNHGIVTVGRNVAEAVLAAVFLERACQQQLLAMASGTVRLWSDDDEALAKRTNLFSPTQMEQTWNYMLRRTR
jgi:ribulose-5-phosphate 4-epimerase/fuculose-1-phosphate aldolase